MTREIVVASGKGGTGKTSLSAFMMSYLYSLGLSVVGVDADVEAPDLLIALGQHKIVSREPIIDSEVAVVDYEKCILCGECYKVCQFGAIDWDTKPIINEYLCEGCNACGIVCPAEAITLKQVKTGDLILADTPYGSVITGELEIGKRHSGKLVELLKRKAREFESKYIIVDAAAGIGCPVVSSIAGADYLVIVAEPTPTSLRSGLRIYEVGKNFGVKMFLVINKFDINEGYVETVKGEFASRGVEYLGAIPYDRHVIEAYSQQKSLIEYAPNSKAAKAMNDIVSRLLEVIKG